MTFTIPVAPVADVADLCDGGHSLGRVHAYLGRFVSYPSEHAHVAHTLWIAHAHLVDAFESSPRLAFLSPEPASGKTRALEVTQPLVPRPVEAVNVSAAYLFRKVADPDGRPTILFDEIDTVFGSKTAQNNEDIRGLLNAGHRKGAVAGRCVVRGKTIETEEIEAYSAVALAGLGNLPDTIITRCIAVRMQRRGSSDHVQPYRRRLYEAEGHEIRDGLADWAESIRPIVTDAWPAMPEGIVDRDSDVWEPLLAIADAAGGEWPLRARVAAVALVALSKESTPSLGIRLLGDMRTVFGEVVAMSTVAIIEALTALDEAPWSELAGGKPLNSRGLARYLNQYGVKSKDVRTAGRDTALKGYTREDLWDAWSRYLPPLLAKDQADEDVRWSPKESATSATSAMGQRAAEEEFAL